MMFFYHILYCTSIALTIILVSTLFKFKHKHLYLPIYRQCFNRWSNISRTKGPWTEIEEARLVELVKIHGAQKWSVIANALPGRIGKQCRERWHNHLNPDINKTPWTFEEDQKILDAHRSMVSLSLEELRSYGVI